MYFRFTLFNSITLLILGFTLWTAVTYASNKLDRNWPFLYYLLVLAYWRIFEGALNTYWVFGGLICALLVRFEPLGGFTRNVFRWLELVALAYIFLRGVDLLV
jgi:hypothetical protein